MKDCKYKDDYTRSYEPKEVGTPEEQAKALHYFLDWMKAVCKRTDDNRIHTKFWTRDLLIKIQKGMPLGETGWPPHYEGD